MNIIKILRKNIIKSLRKNKENGKKTILTYSFLSMLFYKGKILRLYMFSAMINKVDGLIKETKSNFEITTFGIKDIKRLININSKENKDKKILEDYKNKSLNCSVCKKNISINISEFGGVIKNSQNKWILLCRDLNCYNKALSE